MSRIRMRRVQKAPPPARPKLPAGRAPGEREPKVERLRRLILAENWHAALKMAAQFTTLGEDKATIERAWQALSRPDFVRGMHKDPEAMVEAGKAALRRRFGGPAS